MFGTHFVQADSIAADGRSITCTSPYNDVHGAVVDVEVSVNGLDFTDDDITFRYLVFSFSVFLRANAVAFRP